MNHRETPWLYIIDVLATYALQCSSLIGVIIITYYQVTAVGYLSDHFYILQLYSE